MTGRKEIQNIIGGFKNLCSIKLESLKEMNEFMDSAKPPKLNKVEINNLNRHMTNEEIEVTIKSLPAAFGGDAFFPPAYIFDIFVKQVTEVSRTDVLFHWTTCLFCASTILFLLLWLCS